MADRGLTTTEVADLLGVKRETIYAYVSRGILHRRLAEDGRTSLFDRREIDELRRGRRSEQEGELRTLLATRITFVSDEGLIVRGHDLVAMARGGAGFTDVADLLWEAPPDERWPPIADPTQGLDPGAEGPPVERRPLSYVDQLRISVAGASSADPLRHDLSPKSVRAAGRRAITAMVGGVTTPDLLRSGASTEPIADANGTITLAAALWPRLVAGPAEPARLRALDLAMAVLADHGIASSTFAARVAASVRADPYSVVAAGLGVFAGPLHGGASALVHELYAEAWTRGDPAAVIGDLQRAGKRVPGFGHLVYRVQDPRYGALLTQIVDAWADDRRLETVFRVRDLVGERSDAVPNVDLALGALTFLAGMPPHAGEVIFAIARTAGWLAHAMEEYEERAVRFRPKARYIGVQPD